MNNQNYKLLKLWTLYATICNIILLLIFCSIAQPDIGLAGQPDISLAGQPDIGLAARTEVIDLDIISFIESSNNPQAVSFRGAKYGRGLYQVSEIALRDYNIQNRTEIAPTALFDPKVCREVAEWLFNVRIPQFLRNLGYPVTIDNLLWCYSAGISNMRKGIKLNETQKYIAKYKRLEQRKMK